MIHYDPRRWLGVVFRVDGSVFGRVAGRALAIGLLGVAVTYLRYRHLADVAIPGTAHAMVGVALGLLLVFRTNASYDRYWEGRKLLGGMVNQCRDLARMSAVFLAPPVRPRAAALVSALYVTIGKTLRGDRDMAGLVRFDEAERAALARAGAPALLIARWLTELIAAEHAAGRVSADRERMLSAAVGRMIDHWGGAERIVKTPVPFAYAHHIKAFLSLFCWTAPFALVASMGWFTPAAAAALAYALYGIDEIGVEIEDPFGHDANDLPVDAIGATIDGNVMEAMEITE